MSKNRNVIPGLAIHYTENYIREKAEKKPKIYDQDTENRKEMIRKFNEFIEAGKSIDEAVDLILQDDIMEKFDYWKKNNLDVRQCIVNVVRARKNIRETKERGE